MHLQELKSIGTTLHMLQESLKRLEEKAVAPSDEPASNPLPSPGAVQRQHSSGFKARGLLVETDNESDAVPPRPLMYPSSHHVPAPRLDALEYSKWDQLDSLDALKLDSFEGFYNLAMLALGFSLTYMMVRNVREKGLLLDLADFTCPSVLRDAKSFFAVISVLYVAAGLAYYIVRAGASRSLSWHALVALYLLVQLALLGSTVTFLFNSAIAPLPSGAIMITLSILMLKMHSYVATNYAMYREKRERYGLLPGGSSSGISGIACAPAASSSAAAASLSGGGGRVSASPARQLLHRGRGRRLSTARTAAKLKLNRADDSSDRDDDDGESDGEGGGPRDESRSDLNPPSFDGRAASEAGTTAAAAATITGRDSLADSADGGDNGDKPSKSQLRRRKRKAAAAAAAAAAVSGGFNVPSSTSTAAAAAGPATAQQLVVGGGIAGHHRRSKLNLHALAAQHQHQLRSRVPDSSDQDDEDARGEDETAADDGDVDSHDDSFHKLKLRRPTVGQVGAGSPPMSDSKLNLTTTTAQGLGGSKLKLTALHIPPPLPLDAQFAAQGRQLQLGAKTTTASPTHSSLPAVARQVEAATSTSDMQYLPRRHSAATSTSASASCGLTSLTIHPSASYSSGTNTRGMAASPSPMESASSSSPPISNQGDIISNRGDSNGNDRARGGSGSHGGVVRAAATGAPHPAASEVEGPDRAHPASAAPAAAAPDIISGTREQKRKLIKAWPHNVTLKDFVYFLAAPTLT